MMTHDSVAWGVDEDDGNRAGIVHIKILYLVHGGWSTLMIAPSQD